MGFAIITEKDAHGHVTIRSTSPLTAELEKQAKALDKYLEKKIQEIEKECLDLFNQRFIPGRGPTGISGTDEVAFSICYLRSAANMLERLNEGRSLRKENDEKAG